MSQLTSDLNDYNETRRISSTLMIAAMVTPKSYWAVPVLKDLKAIEHACQSFSDSFGRELIKNFKTLKNVPNLGFSNSVKFKLVPTETGKYSVLISQAGNELVLTWFDEIKTWAYTSSNGSIHSIYNIINSIQK